MRLRLSYSCVLAACALSEVLAKSSWGFQDGTVAVHAKGSGVGASSAKEKLSPNNHNPTPISLSSSDTLKLVLTATEDKTPKRPHQAFLTLTEISTGLEDSFALSVKESGKAKLDLTHKDLPIQLITSSKPLTATITLASFGSTSPYRSPAFTISIALSSTAPLQPPPPPSRYSALPEIHHIFKPNPNSPPVFITALFGCAVFVTLPVLLGVWLELGMNLNHMPEAFNTAPAAQAVFWGSVVTMEIVFFLYYVKWNLFQTLPVATVVSGIAFLSGGRALREVQGRRLAGKR